jgi:hypothetical protein
VCPGLTLAICDVNMDKSKYCGYLTATAITNHTKSHQSQVDDVAMTKNILKSDNEWEIYKPQ